MAATPAHPSAPDGPPVSQPHAGPSGRPIQPAPPHLAAARAPSADSATDDGGARKRAKRRKVNHACLYCRRSHMTCDEGRPCQRWSVYAPCEGREKELTRALAVSNAKLDIYVMTSPARAAAAA
jgi:hypothetical protein